MWFNPKSIQIIPPSDDMPATILSSKFSRLRLRPPPSSLYPSSAFLSYVRRNGELKQDEEKK